MVHSTGGRDLGFAKVFTPIMYMLPSEVHGFQTPMYAKNTTGG